MEASVQNSINFDSADTYYSYIVDNMLNLKNMVKNDISVKATIEVMLLKMTRMQ